MPDPLTPVAPGQPLSISARAWNLVTDAARDHRQNGRPDAPGGRGLAWGGVIEVRALNSTGADLREFRPATVTGVGGYELPTAAGEWQRQPLLTLGVPASASDFPVVTLEAIPAGAIGRVAVEGIVLCDVNVGSTGSAPYASPTPGSTDSLTGSGSGNVRVIHVPDGEGSTRRCVVHLHESSPSAAGGDCTPKYLLGVPELVPDGYGGVAGIAGVEVYANGRARCVVKGLSATCDSGDVPDPPPDFEGATLTVCAYECQEVGDPTPLEGAVTVPDSTEGTLALVGGCATFTLPTTTGTAAILSYSGGGTVYWESGRSDGCDTGPTLTGTGTVASIEGDGCENQYAVFTVGDCLEAVVDEVKVTVPPPP